MSNKQNNPANPTVELDGLEVEITRGVDGALVVSISGPGDDDTTALGSPDIRVWLNDALIYAHGETGDDLQWTPPTAPDQIVVNPDPRAISKKHYGDDQ